MGRHKKLKQYIICPICSKQFIPIKSRSKYCSQECQWEGLKKPKVKHICKQCGKEFYTQSWIKGIYCSKECQSKGYTKPKEIREQERLAKQFKSSIKLLVRTLNKVIIKKQSDINRTCECSYCGKRFISNHNSIYCSDECRRKSNNRKSRHRKDKRIYKNGKPDLSITLYKLYKRDDGVCKICGNVCDWYDIEVRDDGVMIAGDNYPSIDHIKPIAKGGLHQWDNVQLLCRKCNRKKRDNY